MITNYRKEWFNWVAKERRRLVRKNKKATHREAMSAASITWPKQKARLQKRAVREAKKIRKVESSSTVVPPTEGVVASTE
jgi:hypothetical protein